MKQCKEKLEATLLQERQRAADGLAALQAAERKMSVEQMSSNKIEQEKAEEFRMLKELSSSQAVELQQLGKKLTSAQQQLKAEMEAKEAKEAEVQELLKERDPRTGWRKEFCYSFPATQSNRNMVQAAVAHVASTPLASFFHVEGLAGKLTNQG